MPKTMIIRKANDLVEARYKLTLAQQRIILFLTAQIRKGDKDFQEYAITVSDFCKYLELDPGNIYEDFIQISNSLIAKTLIIGKDEKTTVTSWLSSAEYLHDKGMILLQFSPKLKDFLLGLQDNFTVYSFNDVKCLKSTYSFRLYELLKQYIKLKERTFYIDDLKEMFQIKNAYHNYNDFKKKVLIIAQRELSEKADICFDFIEIKKSRRVVQIKFLIYPNPKKQTPIHIAIEDIINANIKPDAADVEEGAMEAGEAEGLELVEELRLSPEFTPELPFIEESLTPAQRLAIYKAAGGDMGLIKSRYESMKDKPNVRDLVGYLIKVLQLPGEEYGSPVKPASGRQGLVPKNRFINFQQREIDFEELERLELEQLKEHMRNH